MLINELRMNQDSVISDVPCSMLISCKIVSKSGQVKMVGDNKFEFITKDNFIEFDITDINYEKWVTDAFKRKLLGLAYVTACGTPDNPNIEDQKLFFLHIGFFYNYQRWGKTPVIINDDVKKELENKYLDALQGVRRTLEQILEDNFMLSDGIGTYFAYTVGKYNFEKDSEDVEDADNITEAEINSKDSFVIYGREFNFYTTIVGEGTEAKLFVEKLNRKRNNLPMMRIVRGELEFFDRDAVLSKKVKEALENTKGYLDLWNQYAEQEGKLLLERARTVGLINLKSQAQTIDGEGIHVPYFGLSKEAEKLIVTDCFLLFSDEIPPYLADSEMTWFEYRALSKIEKSEGNVVPKRVQVRVSSKKNGGFVLCPEDNVLPSLPYVSLSILGDESQITRREEARKRIAEGKAANPALGLILEGQLTENINEYSTMKNIDPLSAFVKEKIFKYEPTETQKRAIEIALNTPDIAIIQGPPGTGKTTVITAIVERLNELCDKRDKINGQVLITSFQHDAVRNVIERLRVNSLPTIKFGKRERGGEEDLTREKIVEEWCEDYIQRLSEKNPELAETEQHNMLRKLHDIYIAYPSDRNAVEFLKCAKELNVDNNLDERINRLIEIREINESDNNSKLIKNIRRLRTTKEGFLDDGSQNADMLLSELEKMGINQEIPENKRAYDVLDKAAELFGEEPTEELLLDLKEVKSYLLEKCIPKPMYKKDVPDSEITEIYKTLNRSVKSTKDEKSAILADLLRELRTNRTEVERSLEHYLFVYAATTQQSEGREIKRAKGTKDRPEYDTVIVDEAARVSPTDLMIPISQAKKRIILVGDHRQLPHIYDEEVFESLKENGESVDMNNIRKSMFEYLLEKARELEKTDHIQRSIILDAQYRMHPILGELVHQIFYAPHDEHFKSPMPADNYSQPISKKPFPVEWYDFPNKYGSEAKKNTSRVRDCEADFIVQKLSKYVNSDNGKTLSYGVITFYSEQVKNIKNKLNAKLGSDAERIRVGSVDAFQGMEFDVIFLSVVRSSDSFPKVREEKGTDRQKIDFDRLESDENYREKVGIQNYGFLVSENRLCVSLSRQKKLLIVVGNSEMFGDGDWGEVAKICVPGMKELYDLCKKEGVIYDGGSEGF